MSQSNDRPVVFVVAQDRKSADLLVAGLCRRYANDFAVRGASSRTDALAALRALADGGDAVALLVVDDASSAVLASAHALHPGAKRVLLVDRDYTTSSPAVQAMLLGRVDFHIVRPWADDESMYGAMSQYLAAWTREQRPSFELFRIVAAEGDGRVRRLRDVMTRFGMASGLYSAESEAGRRLLDEAGLEATQLPAVIRYDGVATVDPGLPDLAQAVGLNVENDVETCDVAIVGAGPAGLADRRLRRVRRARHRAAGARRLGRPGRAPAP